MRAEEGDETVKDYAAEGREAVSKIKSTPPMGRRLKDVARRFTGFLRGEHAKPAS